MEIDVHLAFLCFPKLSSFADMRWVFQRRAAGQHHPKRLPPLSAGRRRAADNHRSSPSSRQSCCWNNVGHFFLEQEDDLLWIQSCFFFKERIQTHLFFGETASPRQKSHSYKAGLLRFSVWLFSFTLVCSRVRLWEIKEISGLRTEPPQADGAELMPLTDCWAPPN